ncbi:hypothetical protein P8A21_39645 (plasmid) [Streptomyces poriferorum]|nr:hypothetical protein [Streptomyces sp. Alt1]WLQ53667.1 hypothetical protein P8A21_39645 [Streptomyces sp. Alt1]
MLLGPVRALSAGQPDVAEQLLARGGAAGANLRLEVLWWGC